MKFTLSPHVWLLPKLLLGLAILLAMNACSAEQPKLPEGRCVVPGDCPEGMTCRNTFCEDIYHPRREIKPY